MKLKELWVGVSSLALLSGGCGSNEQAQAPAAEPLKVTKQATKKRPIEEPLNTSSACTALYSGPAAAAVLTNAAVDPELVTDGSVRTLILSFNEDEKVPVAADLLKSTLGLQVGQGLGVFENLPMLALRVPVTPALITQLKTLLQPLSLISITQDKPLKYFLRESVAFIQADVARTTFQTTGNGIGVAVIDSGIDKTQGDFANVVKNVKIAGPIIDEPAGGYLYVDLENTDLTSGHGTHVASTVGGSGASSAGKYKGVAPGARIVGVGTGDAISILYALQGFDFAMKPEIREQYNVRVLSNSWGTSGQRFDPNNAISIASKRAYDLGMVVAFAAGNDGPGADTLNPYSASPCVISVGAGDKTGKLVDFSSRGVPGDGLHYPDIVAPGYRIVAARAATGAITPPYTGDTQYGAFYSSISGTSMATPHISGVAALILEVNPALNLDGVLGLLTSTATPMNKPDGTPHAPWEAGAGYVNAFKAIEAAHKLAGSRSTLQTTRFDAWTGNVALAIDGVTSAMHEYTLAIPAGSTAVRIRTDWGNPALDLDLYVFGPDGAPVGSSAQAATAYEEVSLRAPAAGNYRVRLNGWLTVPTSYTGTAERDVLVPLPAP